MIVTAALALPSTPAAPQAWKIEPSVAAEIDVTDNVKLAPPETRQGDVVTQIKPRLAFSERGSRTSLEGMIALPILLYARTGGDNNRVSPEIDVTGNAELYPRLFFVDGAVHVSQQYLSPFGARPQNLVNATDNRYTAQSYRISPYLRGEPTENIRYELRDNNIWTDANAGGVTARRAYTNEIIGNVTREPKPLGAAVDYKRVETRFSAQQPLLSELERVRGLWRPDAQFELSASTGYERNDYPLLETSGAIYGAGVRWRPTERTAVDASWEHRFFGASYRFAFDHRTPLTVWTVHAKRDTTTYPQQLASLAGGSDVAALLDRLFSSRIVDPLERQSVVDQLIRDRGLPLVLDSPLTLFTQSVTLQESADATVGLLGARNAVFLTAFRLRSEPLTSGEVTAIDLITAQNNNTQTGAHLVWTYKLSALYTLTTSGNYVRTISNIDSGDVSNQRALYTVLSAPLSPLTSVYAGARHQRLTSTFRDGYRETAAFVGITHIFR